MNLQRLYRLIPVCLVMLFASFTRGILEQLDLSEKQAKSAIRDNFINNELWFPDNKTIKQIAIAERATTVRDLGQYIRKYVESSEFSNAYFEAREAAKPSGGANRESLIADRLAAIEEELNAVAEKTKNASADIKKLYELTVKQLNQEREALKNPSHPMHADYLENLTEESEDENQQREMEVENFESRYPSTIKQLLKQRLEYFLEVTSTIDFNAELVQRGRFKVFVDPELEAKDGDWKKMFRAGPETIGAARLFAQQWLDELKKTKSVN